MATGGILHPNRETIFGFTGTTAKTAALAVLMAGVTVFHFSLPEQSEVWHQSRSLAQKLFFLPILLSAAWFGGPGAAASTAVVTGICGVALAVTWTGDLAVQVGRMGEVGIFWLVGGLAANFFEQQRKYVRHVEEANGNTLIALASALDVREHGTGLHSRRVAEFTLRLAEEMKITEPATLAVFWKGAMLHDIGKIGIPDSVLLKPGPLTDGEWTVIRSHPEVGFGMLQRIDFLREPAEIVLCHHERFDGQGYPRGLKGEEIPLGARLFAVIDVYDALTTVRAYHDAATHAAAVATMRAESSRQFDPGVMRAFERVPAEEWAAIAAKNHERG